MHSLFCKTLHHSTGTVQYIRLKTENVAVSHQKDFISLLTYVVDEFVYNT